MRTILFTFLLIFACGCASERKSASGSQSDHFSDWPAGKSPTEIGKRVAARFVASPHPNTSTRPLRRIIYPEVCAWYGALTFADATKNAELRNQLVARFEPLFNEEKHLVPQATHVDFTVFAAVPFELYLPTKEQRYLKLAQPMADQQWSTPVGPAATQPAAQEYYKKGFTWQTRMWIDDMYMITAAQAQAYRATGDRKYIDRAAKQMVLYLDELQEENGLFYHAPDVPFFWGRGDGWMAAGMAELLRSLPKDHPDRPRIFKGYKLMMESLLTYQDDNGMWRQLIDDPQSWPETSCTGMFAFAFVTGVKHGWLDENKYGPAARKAWLALTSYLEPSGDIREVCQGTNKKNDRQYYLDRKRLTGDMHGQAALLWCATALVRGDSMPTMTNHPRMIDRDSLVRRHNVVLKTLDAMNPLSVGNGEFAFTADPTGLQTFPELYEQTIPLCTQSQWGWHSFPMPTGLSANQFRYTEFDTHGRLVGYAVDAKGQETLFQHLRESPHRLHLGRIALALRHADGRPASPEDLTEIHQTLDLWTGLLTSEFTFAGERVTVETCCAGERDGVGVRVRSPLVRRGQVAVMMTFPYGSPSMQAADWSKPHAHETRMARPSANRATFIRTLDADRYHSTLAWSTPATLNQEGPHTFILRAADEADTVDFTCSFAADAISASPESFADALRASEQFWSTYWRSGAALELAGSTDPRAHELERRIVLSQYLTRINSAGSIPPAETGLTCNSWYGKPHLEMHWWHGVHFALWGRLPLLEKSLSWYERILPVARATAQRQGYAGVRWPKMVGPDGTDSPSPVAPLLLWQQPHPIFYAELCYRAQPTPETLSRWREIVDLTAEFMGSFLVFNDATGHYDLGPPMKTVSENADARTTKNAAFELSYWRFGLRTAQTWRERLGQPRRKDWDDMLARLAPLPQAEGCYLFQDNTPDTYTKWNWEHPALLGVRGVLPGDGTDAAVHRRTVERVMQDWQWDRCWGWDFPMAAMAAARAGRPDLAVDALFIQSKKNTYSIAGHNYQRPNLPLYLPANGGLLAAVAMMAAGWDGATGDAPGFPKTGWVVRHEGFQKMPAVDGDQQ